MTSNWKLVKLDFQNTPAHFGELGIGLEETSERIRSDTLFSALAISYARLGNNIGDLLDRFLKEENPPFRLSSTFLFRQIGNQAQPIYYLPKPLKFPTGYPIGGEEDDLKFAKEYKSLRFLPLPVWQRWYQGNGFEDSDRQELIAKATKQSSTTQHLKQSCAFSYGEAFKFEKHPKVAIDRITRATNLYHTGFVRYRSEDNDKSGLYFLIELNEASLENDLRGALELLGEEGIGGERSSGAGRFEPSWHDLSKKKNWNEVINFSQGNYHSLMSLYWDDKEKLVSLENSSYELQERGGWITSDAKNQRRKKVTMFAEGSVFRQNPKGNLADVTPRDSKGNRLSPHNIYRSGIALSLPIKIIHREAL